VRCLRHVFDYLAGDNPLTAKQSTLPSRRGAATGLRAVILAGGKGVRLLPFTANFPKPLVPLGNTPVLEVLMRRLICFGVRDITLTLGHLAELVKAYFHHRGKLDPELKLRYIVEEKPTGTAGALAMVRGHKDTFLVMNGDLLTDLDFHELVAFHHRQRATLTIATHKRDIKIDLGVSHNRLSREARAYLPCKHGDLCLRTNGTEANPARRISGLPEPRVKAHIGQRESLRVPI